MAKKIAAISALVLVASVCFSQVTSMTTSWNTTTPGDSLTLTTTWQKVLKDASNPYQKILGFELINDGGAGSKIFYAYNDDTSSVKRFTLLNSSSVLESVRDANLYISHIYLKAAASTVAVRIRVW